MLKRQQKLTSDEPEQLSSIKGCIVADDDVVVVVDIDNNGADGADNAVTVTVTVVVVVVALFLNKLLHFLEYNSSR